MRPLEGVTVVTLEHAIAAPFCTRQLADLGARVIKVERPGVGDFARAYDTRVRGQASHFVWTNRSKESLTLDLKHPQATEVLARLLKTADVLVQNLAPGAAARLGLSYSALCEKHPALIVCDISGYGDDPLHPGPYRDKKAYDLLIQSEAGFLSITGTPEGAVITTARTIGRSVASASAASRSASSCARRRTIEGRLFDCRHRGGHVRLLEHHGGTDSAWQDGTRPPDRHIDAREHGRVDELSALLRFRRRRASPARRRFACHDLPLQNEREWHLFCAKVLLQPALANDERFNSNARRVAAKPALHQLITEHFASLTIDEVIARLEDAQIANAHVNTMQDVWAHPQLKARGRWVDVATPNGPVPALLPPGLAESFDARMDAVPALGQHTVSLLSELGFTPAEIERMKTDATV